VTVAFHPFWHGSGAVEPADQEALPHTFEVLPLCWVIEHTFARISKHRRTTRDDEHLPASHEAMILWP
jgi:transposase